jgi:hypothetical protein
MIPARIATARSDNTTGAAAIQSLLLQAHLIETGLDWNRPCLELASVTMQTL